MTGTAEFRDLLATPYALGGRTIGVGIDCLGIVGEIARRRGIPAPDGWPSIRAAWQRGEIDAATGFPAGWRRVHDCGLVFEELDVLLFFSPHPWCAIVDGGRLWSASELQGSAYCLPLSRLHRDPDEVWRFAR